jgi:hypothetical protein
MSRSIIIAIYYLVLVLAIGLSSYFSFLGFLPTLGNTVLSGVFVAIIALGLFAAGTLIQIGRDRKSGREQFLAVLLFSVFAIFSTSSNFTYLYTNIRSIIERENAINEERGKFETVVKALQSVTSIAVEKDRTAIQDLVNWYGRLVSENLAANLDQLSTVDEYTDFVASIDTLKLELDNMITQANDPGRAGCGQRCLAHYDTINGIVTKMTNTAPTDIAVPRSAADFGQFFTQYERRVWESVCGSQEDLVAIYVLRTSAVPSLQCARPSHIRRTDIVEFTNSLDSYTIGTVNEFLKELGAKVSIINNTLATRFQIQLASIETSIDTAMQAYAEANQLDITSEGFSSELINQKEQLLTTLNAALEVSSGKRSLLFDNESCSIENTSNDPRACLSLMNSQLRSLKSDFSNLFIEQNMPEVARDLNINQENGQIGTIKDTLFNGFVEMPSLPTTVFAFFMGLMIDVLPLVFAFVAFHGYVRPETEIDPWGNIS